MICRDNDLPLIVAIDLQPMAPIEGVIQVQGDITNARTAEVVRMVFNLKFSIMFILCGRVMVFVASSE
jgi:23S rRNA U2552 (ribose-2'-O)-methylase RlmE/FtsJ